MLVNDLVYNPRNHRFYMLDRVFSTISVRAIQKIGPDRYVGPLVYLKRHGLRVVPREAIKSAKTHNGLWTYASCEDMITAADCHIDEKEMPVPTIKIEHGVNARTLNAAATTVRMVAKQYRGVLADKIAALATNIEERAKEIEALDSLYARLETRQREQYNQIISKILAADKFPPGMNPNDIRLAIKERRWSLEDLSALWGMVRRLNPNVP